MTFTKSIVFKLLFTSSYLQGVERIYHKIFYYFFEFSDDPVIIIDPVGYFLVLGMIYQDRHIKFVRWSGKITDFIPGISCVCIVILG